MAEVARGLERGHVRLRPRPRRPIAIDIDLAMPLRPQNLSALTWRRHFMEPDGSKGRLCFTSQQETKSKLQDMVAEMPDDVARRLAGTGDTSCHVSAPTRMGIYSSPRTETEDPGDSLPAVHPNSQTTPRRAHDPTPAATPRGDLAPGRAPRGLRDAEAFLGHAWRRRPASIPVHRAAVPAVPTVASYWKRREALKLKRKRQRKPSRKSRWRRR